MHFPKLDRGYEPEIRWVSPSVRVMCDMWR